jgi:hypothetical protein
MMSEKVGGMLLRVPYPSHSLRGDPHIIPLSASISLN